ncbi:hypothetical protein [Streptomyces scopuliridis]|uniref:hypothetical protein n=1 Tax=Streptomyces scopuliridis TaxID=452529 RepID=UPI0036949CDF
MNWSAPPRPRISAATPAAARPTRTDPGRGRHRTAAAGPHSEATRPGWHNLARRTPSAAAARPGSAAPDPAGTTRLVRVRSRPLTRHGEPEPLAPTDEAGEPSS